jgi:hypothetical protein
MSVRHHLSLTHTHGCAPGVAPVSPFRPGSAQTYLKKCLCPVAVKVISQPGQLVGHVVGLLAEVRMLLRGTPRCARAQLQGRVRQVRADLLGTAGQPRRGWLPEESVLDWRECEPESGSLKKDSGRIFFPHELALGFMTELKRVTRSVSRSCVTWITCCPGGGSGEGTEDGFIFCQEMGSAASSKSEAGCAAAVGPRVPVHPRRVEPATNQCPAAQGPKRSHPPRGHGSSRCAGRSARQASMQFL